MTWDNICRVCSSPADYKIFAKIPTYLHASTNDFLNWQKPINILLEEVTGLKVTSDDNLPNCICAPCISYMKHAVLFREQFINNSLSLTTASIYQNGGNSSATVEDKESVLITAQDLTFIERPVNSLLLNNATGKRRDRQDKVNKQLLNQNNMENYEQQMRYLNLLFDKDANAGLQPKYRHDSVQPESSAGGSAEEEYPTPPSSDENEESGTIKVDKNFYNYKEKNFEEDDIMDLDELRQAITIKIPESCKERKCRACSRRFMFEDTYIDHINSCPEFYFFTLIEEVNRLLLIRTNKAVSPHEFIRRMIFCVRKACEWLKKNSVEDLLIDVQQDNTGKFSGITDDKKLTILPGSERKTQLLPYETNRRKHNNKLDDIEIETLDILEQQTRTATPINASNNILYEIERSESRSSNQNKSVTPTVKKPIPIRRVIGAALNSSSALRSDELLQSSSPLIVSQKSMSDANVLTRFEQKQNFTMGTPSSSLLMFTARCSLCSLLFDSLTELELHNQQYHNALSNINNTSNKSTPMPLQIHAPVTVTSDDKQRQRIIALFNDDI